MVSGDTSGCHTWGVPGVKWGAGMLLSTPSARRAPDAISVGAEKPSKECSVGAV